VDAEGFLSQHLSYIVAPALLALTWAANRKLITTWHYLLGAASVVTLVLYATIAEHGLAPRDGFIVACAAGLWTVAYHQRPRRPRPDGSHEAL
jgi:hypothetical protein